MNRVFVYGTLKTGHELNGIMRVRGARRVDGDASVRGLALTHLRAYPAAVPASDSCYILGEVWECSASLVKELDRIELGAGYRKRKVEAFGEVSGEKYRNCIVYVRDDLTHDYSNISFDMAWEWEHPQTINVTVTGEE